ncbi:hypothetical protein ADIS_1613 [Lunatimonas lonarensis]|uniref:Uncharacterized protein n=1 Tax=Lunatimonas lonarensis TaxID=1232681 RepID=R7ZUS5_9BACT|nr:hypothetical protein ADIS_1613 [Lunatimonas lonarensis]
MAEKFSDFLAGRIPIGSDAIFPTGKGLPPTTHCGVSLRPLIQGTSGKYYISSGQCQIQK